MKFSYQLSKAAARAAFVATGNGDIGRFVESSVETLAPEQRRLLLDAGLDYGYGGVSFGGEAKLPETPAEVSAYKDYSTGKAHLSGNVELDHLLADVNEWFAELARILEVRKSFEPARLAKQAEFDAEAAARAEQKRQEKIEQIKRAIEQHDPTIGTSDWQASDLDGLVGQYLKLVPQFKAEAKEREEKAKAEAEAKKQAARAERSAWVQAHGSDYLKRACARDHDCQRLYIAERAAMEAPGFVVDFYDNAGWKDRTCPSERALDEADQADKLGIGKADIVWLTEPPHDKREDEDGEEEEVYDFEKCEAVIIRKWLGRYDLVKAL